MWAACEPKITKNEFFRAKKSSNAKKSFDSSPHLLPNPIWHNRGAKNAIFQNSKLPGRKRNIFQKKSLLGPKFGIFPLLAHFACKPHVGQKLPKMAFFEPKNRGIQKNISTVAHICCQTPCGTTGRSKTPLLVNFWRFWPFSGFFACKSAIFAFLVILAISGGKRLSTEELNSEKKSWRLIWPPDGAGYLQKTIFYQMSLVWGSPLA